MPPYLNLEGVTEVMLCPKRTWRGGGQEAEVVTVPRGSGVSVFAAARRGAGGGRHGEPHGKRRAQHPRHQPAVPRGEDHSYPHLRVQVLERGMLRPHGYGGLGRAGSSRGGRH